jgi:hypothetical protein
MVMNRPLPITYEWFTKLQLMVEQDDPGTNQEPQNLY